MNIHLLTLVGGHIDVLPFMLTHYREKGIQSFHINVHAQHKADPVIDEVRVVTNQFGCGLGAIGIGSWEAFELDAWLATMRSRPDDWWILADQDELHTYADDLTSLLAFCDRHNYDYIRGSLVDRLCADGTFPHIALSTALWHQYPLGGLLTTRLLGGQTLKIVAAKGRVTINTGHHLAWNGRGCPINDAFVQVHHFKWTAGVIERQRARAEAFRHLGRRHWVESARFVKYCDTHNNRIDTTDQRLLIAPCEPGYPYWKVVLAASHSRRALVIPISLD